MAKVVKKKKKKGIRSFSSGGGSSIETSSLRPVFVQKLAPCMDGCPNQNDIRGFLNALNLAEKHGRTREEAMKDSWDIDVLTNPYPAVCGRVCPHPCETVCNRKEKDTAVGINNFERYLGDYALENNFQFDKPEETHDEKIAVVGSGPAGMSCAYQLAKSGYSVTVFEAFPEAGGMLRYGIPAYRLPRNILNAENQRILDLGVELKLNTTIGKDVSLSDLKKDYKAVFVSLGAHKGKLLRLESEDAENVWTGTEFLHKLNSDEKIDTGDHVVVIGGGDTAIDAARMARRLGSKVTILYRRTRKEMPAIDEEIIGADVEGVDIVFLAAPQQLITKDGKVTGMICQRMELGEPDDSGRRRPVPIEGDTYEMECSTIVAAISQEPEFEGFDDLREGRDWVKVDDRFRCTLTDGVYAGGDNIDLGLVVDAIYHGRRAAQTIHHDLRGTDIPEDEKQKIISHEKMLLSYYEEAAKREVLHLDPEACLKDGDAEITSTLSDEDATLEALRCMSCGNCFECGQCWSFCQDGAIKKPILKGDHYSFKMEFCNGCKKCEEQCPCGYIEMH